MSQDLDVRGERRERRPKLVAREREEVVLQPIDLLERLTGEHGPGDLDAGLDHVIHRTALIRRDRDERAVPDGAIRFNVRPNFLEPLRESGLQSLIERSDMLRRYEPEFGPVLADGGVRGDLAETMQDGQVFL